MKKTLITIGIIAILTFGLINLKGIALVIFLMIFVIIGSIYVV